MKRLVAALVAVLAVSAVISLSACAVTGQPARPGTAAIYDGGTITTEQVAAWGTAQNDMGFSAHVGKDDAYDPGAALTLLLLRPALDKEAAIEGIAFGDDQISSEAQMWMATNSSEVVAPTADMVDIVRLVRIIHALLLKDDGKAAIKAAVESIAADAQANPVYGRFTLASFGASVDALATQQRADAGTLGDVNYLVFRNLSGFDTNTQRGWMVDEGLASPSPSPSPSPNAAP